MILNSSQRDRIKPVTYSRLGMETFLVLTVHEEWNGVHEGYMRDLNPVSMKGTWRIERGYMRGT